MKTLLLAALLIPAPALATTECAGETFTGTIVSVTVNTIGTMGAVTGATVFIEEKGTDPRHYDIPAAEIPQFFETVSNDNSKAVVGLSAYVENNFPVQFSYTGINYQLDLVSVLRTPGRKKVGGNYMRVWKGPGFPGDQQHSFYDVVCSVTLDP